MQFDIVIVEYALIALMSLWNIILFIEHMIKGEKHSPFFYYVMMIMFGMLVLTSANISIRIRGDVLSRDPEDVYWGGLRSIWWALRLVPIMIPLSFITIDFTVRRFWGKRLFGKFYKNGIGEENKY